MPHYICVRCGVQHAATPRPPTHCPICADAREAVNATGQTWTTLEQLRADHQNVVQPEEPGLLGITTEPAFAIGQRALLVQARGGNVLWDCLSVIDDHAVATIQQQGGLVAIASSHPHLHGALVEWSQAFGGVPIYVHGADRAWVLRPDPAVTFWEGATHRLAEGLTLVRCGGHFAGSTVLHWAAGAAGRGALLTGDTIQVVADRRYVSFMWSYVNLIPLSAAAVRAIVAAVAPFEYDRIYGGWWGAVVASEAQAAVARSAERYLQAIAGER